MFFNFDHKSVNIRDKPFEHFSEVELLIYWNSFNKPKIYLNFFKKLIDGRMHISASVALDVYDLSSYGETAPVFSFQKPVGSHSILLPDIDFILHKWYTGGRHEKPWPRKNSTAVFAGSSTGGNLLTLDDVRHTAAPRLAWALATLDNPIIDFRICSAVQCDTPETANELNYHLIFILS